MVTGEQAAQKQILIVENEGLIAMDLQRRLEQMGFSATTIAPTGEEAIECARSAHFDLALTDIRLEGAMDGIAVASQLKDEFQVPVVFVTAHADDETLERAKLTEPFGYVIRPIVDASLRSAVQIALHRSEVERRLRTSEAWLAATLRSVGDGVIACDTTLGIAFMNHVAERFTDWQSDAAKGKLLADVLALRDETTAAPAKNPILDLFPGENRAYSLVSRSGIEHLVEIGCEENRSTNELLGSVLVLRDISQRREFENRLLQSQRMEAVSSMAGGLAHDFNNLLMIMLGNAEELIAKLSGDEKDRAAEIKQAANMASALTSELLILSRRDLAKAEVLNLNEIVYEMEPLISRSLGDGHTFAADLGSPSAFLWGNRDRLKQVLLNLALNARDAMPAGSELRISTSAIEVDDETPAARQYQPGKYARLCVADTGPGMDKAALARIFEPFFATKTPGAGAGLGLSMVHSIVAQSGGYINASSEPGQGTSFEIMLPSIGTFQRANDSEEPETILLVENESKIRRLMHNYLAREGFQLLEASNGEEAQLLAAVYPEPIHMLVTDVQMPGKNGPELAHDLKSRNPLIKVLFVSGYGHETLADVVGPSAELLSKPFPASELVRRVCKLLSQPAVQKA